ncbi:alpha/beta hydrolase [Nannocystis sp. SCPEA4]|uniref:alpha/beta fold hydrolase n=1 Tax=Nannocystis sp. SCPEA4 TaxID=2996787 RepID=UPI0022719774|nr:alpha/beta hydrolase [Nannocystis sp. SCPEA4]MCY1056522.1 alpha/beta hydrolase [Nannocystis sp. SCPEA4]
MSAIDAPNQFIETNGRRLAYRSIGEGKPIVLCTRFRGNLDCWDPAFLDALAAAGFRVITFDYSGLGLSTGTASYNPFVMVNDPRDLIEALSLRDVVIAGWSLGGIVAQVFVAQHAAHVSHAVLFGTTPPGPIVKPAEPLFFTTAAREVNDFEDEVILFFEPRSADSRAAARRSADRIAARTSGLSPAVPVEFARANLAGDPSAPIFPALPVLAALRATTVPILHVGGDHDIIFPVENWYALNQSLPTVQLLTYPSAGHGPHHQHPEATAEHIATFVRTTARKPAAL